MGLAARPPTGLALYGRAAMSRPDGPHFGCVAHRPRRLSVHFWAFLGPLVLWGTPGDYPSFHGCARCARPHAQPCAPSQPCTYKRSCPRESPKPPGMTPKIHRLHRTFVFIRLRGFAPLRRPHSHVSMWSEDAQVVPSHVLVSDCSCIQLAHRTRDPLGEHPGVLALPFMLDDMSPTTWLLAKVVHLLRNLSGAALVSKHYNHANIGRSHCVATLALTYPCAFDK